MPRQDQSRAKSAELRLMNMNQKYNYLTPYRQDSGNASVLDKNLNQTFLSDGHHDSVLQFKNKSSDIKELDNIGK